MADREKLMRIIFEQKREREESKEKVLVGTIRSDVKHVEHLTFEFSADGHKLFIDEPQSRGGYDKGPSPLNYFLAGAVSCLLMQFQKVILTKNLKAKSLVAICRGHFDRHLGGSFEDIIFDVQIESSESEETIKQVASEAEMMCFAHQTLKKAARVTTNIVLNGKKVT